MIMLQIMLSLLAPGERRCKQRKPTRNSSQGSVCTLALLKVEKKTKLYLN